MRKAVAEGKINMAQIPDETFVALLASLGLIYLRAQVAVKTWPVGIPQQVHFSSPITMSVTRRKANLKLACSNLLVWLLA